MHCKIKTLKNWFNYRRKLLKQKYIKKPKYIRSSQEISWAKPSQKDAEISPTEASEDQNGELSSTMLSSSFLSKHNHHEKDQMISEKKNSYSFGWLLIPANMFYNQNFCYMFNQPPYY